MTSAAAIEWTSRAGGEYKAIHSENCEPCEFTFGDELCRNSPPCSDQHRSDSVPIAWVSKRNPLDVTVPEYDFPAPADDEDEDNEDELTFEMLSEKHKDTTIQLNLLKDAVKVLLNSMAIGQEPLIEQAVENIKEHLKLNTP